MSLLRWTTRIHKWIALIIGIQILLWIAGGFVMSVLPIEQVRGEHKIAPPARAQISASEVLSLEEVSERAGIDGVQSATLGELLGQPVWRITSADGPKTVISALTGDVLSPVPEPLAQRIAEADYSGTGALVALELMKTSPTEYGGPAPVWRARFDDGDHTTLYIDPQTAQVRARRSSTWRFYDFFWKLHVMDYDDGEDFNHPLLISAAGAAIFVAFSGLILLVVRMRRLVLHYQRTRKRKLGT